MAISWPSPMPCRSGPARWVEGALDALVDAVDDWVGDLGRLPFDKGKLRKLRRAIEYRQARLRRT